MWQKISHCSYARLAQYDYGPIRKLGPFRSITNENLREI